ncbi:tetratricopeptide repeat protein [Lentzea tibetensis]|uniref:tetratricopeptide repeat protein n=1 Tax=Lentzea tibetensis TaxID=2591470 RepID=UPI001648E025|nr:tetratricopeptide repeat protein [Lentzea tibetensis]
MSRSSFVDPNLGLAVLQSLISEKVVTAPDWEAVTAAHPPTRSHPNEPARAALLDVLAGYSADVSGLTRLRLNRWTYAMTSACSGQYSSGFGQVFDLTSLAGIELCPELRSIEVASAFRVADLEPLTGLGHLESISIEHAPDVTDWSPLLRIPALRRVTAPVDAEVAAQLVERGVEVSRPGWLAPLMAHPGWPADPVQAAKLLRVPAADGEHTSDPFPDDNLGLAVLHSLIIEGRVSTPDWGALKAANADLDDDDEYDEDEDYDSDYELNTGVLIDVLGLLAEQRALFPDLTELTWEAAQDIQFACYTYWNGECDTFHLKSLAGIEQCFGLRSLDLELFGVADLEPLTRLPRLEKVQIDYAPNVTDWSPLLRIPTLRVVKASLDEATAAELLSRGVRVLDDFGLLVGTADPRLAELRLSRLEAGLLHKEPDDQQEWIRVHDRIDAPADIDTAEAVVVARYRLAEEGAEPRLADALVRLGTMQAAREHWYAAEPALRQAIEILRRLTEADQVTRGPELGAALEALGEQYWLRDEAWGEAIAVYRGLADIDLPRFGPRLADLCGRLAAGRTTAFALERVEVLRRLVAADPEYTADLAASCDALSEVIRTSSRDDETMAAHSELLATYRSLADADPDGDHTKLVDELLRLAQWLTPQGRNEEALAAQTEAAAVCQRLADRDFARHAGTLRSVLARLGVMLSEFGHPDEALATQERVVAVCRRNDSTEPDTELDQALHTLANRLTDVGRHQDALAVQEHRVTTHRECANDQNDLASALTAYGRCLAHLGRADDAMAAWQDSLAIWRRLAELEPDRYRDNLVSALISVSVGLGELGREDDALPFKVEVVDILDQPEQDSPGVLGLALNNLACGLSDLGRHDEALPTSTRAVTVLRGEEGAASPNRFTLALALASAAEVRLAARRDLDAALDSVTEAVTMYEEFAVRWPGRFSTGLAERRATLAGVLDALGRGEPVGQR